MSEFFTGLVQMFQTDPSAFFTAILSYAGITTISGASLYGAVIGTIKLFKAIFKKDKKLMENIRSSVKEQLEPITSDLSDLRLELVQKSKETISSLEASIKPIFSEKVLILTRLIEDIESKLTAFAEVVLDNEQLKLQFEVLQKEFQATKRAFLDNEVEVCDEIEKIETTETIIEEPLIEADKKPTIKVKKK